MEFLSRMLIDPALAAGVLAALACAAAVFSVAAPMFSGDQLSSRLKTVAARREELRRKSRAALDQKSKGIRRVAGGRMHELVTQFNLSKALADDTIEPKLMQAGLRGPGPVSRFYFFRAALPIGFGAFAAFYVFIMGEKLNLPGAMPLAVVLGAAMIGFYAPNLYVSNLIAKRRESIMRAFPDALDMLLISVESGMSIELALGRVGNEIGAASVELAEELALCTAELSYLQDRRLAYENLAKRTDHPGVKSVAMALVQAERYGTPLGHALRVMAKENREMRLMEAEKKAASLPAKLTVPMIVFFLPVLFAVIMGPAMIQVSKMMGGN